MKYLSIDIETTGLDPEKHQIIEFAAVLEDTSMEHTPVSELPSFHRYIKHDDYVVSPYCTVLHQKIFEILRDDKHEEIVVADQLTNDFHSWLIRQGFQPKTTVDKYTDIQEMESGLKRLEAINVAGKNFFQFDYLFLCNHIPYWKALITLRYRSIDPAILYWKPETDQMLPNTDQCISRAGFLNLESKHEALDDARIIIELIRKYYASR